MRVVKDHACPRLLPDVIALCKGTECEYYRDTYCAWELLEDLDDKD